MSARSTDVLVWLQEDQPCGFLAERARSAVAQVAVDSVCRDAQMARAITVGGKQRRVGRIAHLFLLAGLILAVNGCGGKTRTVIQTVPVVTSCLPDTEEVPARPKIIHGCPSVDPDLRDALGVTDRGKKLLEAIDRLELCLDTEQTVRLTNYRDQLELKLRTWRHTYCPRKEKTSP